MDTPANLGLASSQSPFLDKKETKKRPITQINFYLNQHLDQINFKRFTIMRRSDFHKGIPDF